MNIEKKNNIFEFFKIQLFSLRFFFKNKDFFKFIKINFFFYVKNNRNFQDKI